MTGGAADRREKRESDKATKADKRREAAQKRAALEPLAKQIKATEGLIERTRKRIEALDAELAVPSLYERDPGKAAKLAKERSDTVAALDRHEETWLALSSEYEEAMAA